VTVYSTYEYYTNDFCGGLPEPEYDKYAQDAAFEIDRLTFGRASGASATMKDKLAFCECRMIESIRAADSIGVTTTAGVSGVNNDGYSVSFQTDAAAAYRRELEGIAKRYLTFPANLMYCGAMVHDNI
jgi:hypothetical protein